MRAMHLAPMRVQCAVNIPEGSRKMSEAYLWREIKTWRPFRIFGLASSFFAFAFSIICVCSKYWIVGRDFHIGIIDHCYYNGTSQEAHKICLVNKANWQNAVIGLLAFAVAFGFLGTVLTVFGVITTTLTKKIYYYHSAGEIYFICAASCAAAMLAYPVAMKLETKLFMHTYGHGYGLGWGAAFCYLASSMCMCLDDLVRAIVKGLACGCCRRQSNDYPYK